jgi:hypothetical protein
MPPRTQRRRRDQRNRSTLSFDGRPAVQAGLGGQRGGRRGEGGATLSFLVTPPESGRARRIATPSNASVLRVSVPLWQKGLMP